MEKEKDHDFNKNKEQELFDELQNQNIQAGDEILVDTDFYFPTLQEGSSSGTRFKKLESGFLVVEDYFYEKDSGTGEVINRRDDEEKIPITEIRSIKKIKGE